MQYRAILTCSSGSSLPVFCCEIDDKLFQVPPGYQKMGMPGIGGGRMPMGSAGADDEEDDDDEEAPKPPAKGKKK